MKKILKNILTFILAFGAFTTSIITAVGCSGEQKNNTVSIVTTIFPQYDWVKQILGDKMDNAELTLLLDNGADLHNYQPTVEDMVTISTCDLFIYIGGESDEWVDDVLAQATNKDMIVLNLCAFLGDAVKEEEIVDGMENEHDHDHDDTHVGEKDEHIWLSLNNAKSICKEITSKLCSIDPINAETYKINNANYCEKLTELDKKYKQVADNTTVKTLLFADRFAFRYLVEDYGLDYYAAFSGCSAESEASFETIAFLAGKVNELNLKAVVKLEGSDGKIAQTVISTSANSNVKILTMDSMQSVTSKNIAEGATYLSIMEKNLGALEEALK